MEEIRQYLDRPKLTCLLCGHEFAALSHHLLSHKLSPDSYKEMYGLPWSRSLAGTDLREVQSRSLKRTRASGKIGRMPTPEHLQVMRETALRRRRPPIEATRKEISRRIRLSPRQKVMTAPDKMEEYLRRIGTGRTISEVARDEDMPSFQSFYRHCSENPDFLRRFEAVWDQLPFAVQIRGHKIGTRLKKTIAALHHEGKTWTDLGPITGVRESVVIMAWHKCKKSDQAASSAADAA